MKAELTPYTETQRDIVEANLALKELMFREIGGMTVTLYWHPKSNSTSISLLDRNVNLVFLVDGEQAMDAFNHPYAYAQKKGLLQYEDQEYSGEDGA